MDTRKVATIEEILKRNSSEYQHHLTTKNRITKALQHQNNIRAFQTIPKRYLPPTTLEVVTPNPDLTKEFQTEYQQLFFRHLNKIIIHNTITLELENARLKELISRTENQLSTSDIPPETIVHLHKKFYTQNAISQETSPITNPQTTETTNPEPSPSTDQRQNPRGGRSRRPRGRKRQVSSHPNPRKMKKIQQHFLSLSHCPKPPT